MAKHVKSFFVKGIAGVRNGNVKGAVIHNDDGRMPAIQNEAWLKTRNLELGFAHYYIDKDTILQIEDIKNKAWHTGNAEGNAYYIGYEVCQSLGATDADFKKNEAETLKQVAKDFKALGISPNRNTVRLHKEFSATSCPKRSWEMHGKSINAVKDYFISEIKKYMGETSTPNTTTPSVPSTSTSGAKFKVGATVTVSKSATKYQTGQAMASFVKGSKYKIKEVKKVSGKYAYLLDSIVSWVWESDLSSSSTTTNTNTVTTKWIAENGTFTLGQAINLRTSANDKSALIATLSKGSAVKYDAYMIDNDYVWVRQKRGSGYGYLATGNAKNGKRTSYWGTFK